MIADEDAPEVSEWHLVDQQFCSPTELESDLHPGTEQTWLCNYTFQVRYNRYLHVKLYQVLTGADMSGSCRGNNVRCIFVRLLNVMLYQVFQVNPYQIFAGAAMSCSFRCSFFSFSQLQLCRVLAGVATSKAWRGSNARCLHVHICPVIALSGI